MPENQEEFKPGRSGIDYLKFRCYGDFDRPRMANDGRFKLEGDGIEFEVERVAEEPGLFDRLEERQALAKVAESDVFLNMGGIEFLVRGYGSGPYGENRRAYQLEAAGCWFGISPEKNLDDPNKPQMWVEIKGELLTRFGHAGAFKIVKKCFAALGFKYRESKVSRVDFRTDLTKVTPNEIHDLYRGGHVVTKASNKGCNVYYGAGRLVETINFGSRQNKSDIILRVYDKLAEAGTDARKLRAIEDFILCGETVDVLTRFEFELSRKAIADRYKLSSVEDVIGNVSMILDDLTSNYFRIHSREVDRNNTQRAGRLHDCWVSVKRTFQQFASQFHKSKPKPVRRKCQTADEAKNTLLGYLAKIAAMTKTPIRSSFEFDVFLAQQFEAASNNVSAFRKRVKEKASKLAQKSLEDAQRLIDGQQVGPSIQRNFF